MTNQEAIKDLQEQIDLLHKAFGDENNHTEPYKLAIEALEKQVPKKPKIVAPLEGTNLKGYMCPECNTVVADFIGRNFVKLPTCYCGQLLDWSEVEE